MAGGTISRSFEKFDNVVVDVDWAAQLAGSALYEEWQVTPAQGDIVHAGVDTAPATAQYCCDADMLVPVVPSTYATFVAKFRPLLQVRHMAMTANGKKVLTATTSMVPEPHVRSMAFRMHIMDSSASRAFEHTARGVLRVAVGGVVATVRAERFAQRNAIHPTTSQWLYGPIY